MKFRQIKNKDSLSSVLKFEATKKGVKYSIRAENPNSCFVLLYKKATKKVYNSLWDKKTFNSVEAAQEWCEGVDVKKIFGKTGIYER